MKYKVIYEDEQYLSDKIAKLTTEVNKLIQDGWKPLGGISVSVDRYANCCFAQAMIKEDE